jgi:Cu-Zn family superoxide dismutase
MKNTIMLAALLGAVALGGCNKKKEQPAEPPVPAPADAAMPAPPPPDEHAVHDTPPPAAGRRTAVADLAAASGSKVTGKVTFVEENGTVEATVHIEGAPDGDHGFHIHEKGDCSAPDATSAGGHFNPGHMDHGAPDAPAHHAGDFGNIKVEKGMAHAVIKMSGITLGEGETSIIGKGVILHEKVDDFKTQPTGNAGARIACGVIKAEGDSAAPAPTEGAPPPATPPDTAPK